MALDSMDPDSSVPWELFEMEVRPCIENEELMNDFSVSNIYFKVYQGC